MSKKKSYRYVLITLSGALMALLIVVGINWFVDIYGLFRGSSSRKIQVYHNERETKYLFSYAYIPDNFNTILIGPSLSDNIDAEQLSTNELIVYNASVMGANISELKRTVENAVKSKKITQVIICLHPYLTKNSEIRESELNEKTYYGALGSLNLYQTYALAMIREWNLLPRKFPNGQISWNGTNNYYDFFRVGNVASRIIEEAKVHSNEEILIDSKAISDLRELIENMHNEKVKVMGYFHPVPVEIYDANKLAYLGYQKEISAVFEDEDKIIDFNLETFTTFRSDASNFIDHGHLSEKGQSVIVEELKANW
jgi:hypothetical protein